MLAIAEGQPLRMRRYVFSESFAAIANAAFAKAAGDAMYARWHRLVHDWSFQHFADPEFGEWYGYLHRDGSISSRVKGTMYKGPFRLPRMLWYCDRLCQEGKCP